MVLAALSNLIHVAEQYLRSMRSYIRLCAAARSPAPSSARKLAITVLTERDRVAAVQKTERTQHDRELIASVSAPVSSSALVLYCSLTPTLAPTSAPPVPSPSFVCARVRRQDVCLPSRRNICDRTSSGRPCPCSRDANFGSSARPTSLCCALPNLMAQSTIRVSSSDGHSNKLKFLREGLIR